MTLSSIEGRLVSVCIGEGGRMITHGEIDDVLGTVEGIAQYRLVQETAGSVNLWLVGEDSGGRRAAAESSAALRDLFGAGIEVSVEEVSSIAPERSGKFLLVRRAFPLDTASILRAGDALNG